MSDQDIDKAMTVIGLALIGIFTLGAIAIIAGIVAAVIA